jgi:hypothetical protein
MKTITLMRYGFFPDATFGMIRYDRDPEFRILYSVEREWKYNQRFTSCLPPGLYGLKPYSGSKYKNTFALVSDKLRVFATKAECIYTTDRFACILHPGSWGYNFEGCIGNGFIRIAENNKWGVGQTTDGVAYLIQYIRDHNITNIRIRNYRFSLTAPTRHITL